MNITQAIQKISDRQDLTENEMRSVFDQIMTGGAEHEDIVSFLVALSAKGETVDEITGGARVMREKALKINVEGGAVLDTCGTGGSGLDTFNISTTAAFVLAGGGVKVAKHGNRSVSSKCGSADVLEAIGVKIDVPATVVETCINEINVGFLFAPLFHSAMKHAIGPRKEIGKRTIFNILGPLSNPASATCQVLGVFDETLTATMAEVLGHLGSERAFVVHGSDGLDEVTITGSTKVSELKEGKVSTYKISPSDFGLDEAELDSIKGGSARENAALVRAVLSGEKGPKRDIVLLNSGIAFVAAGKVDDVEAGLELARESIDSGKAIKTMESLVEMTGKAE